MEKVIGKRFHRVSTSLPMRRKESIAVSRCGFSISNASIILPKLGQNP
jgi:hypothetical protein